MARALLLPKTNTVLQSNPKLEFRKGPYAYRVETSKDGVSTYTVSDGKQSISAPVQWAFGAHTQTFVLEHQGKLYESLVTYYPGASGLDVTMGDERIEPKSLLEAFGRELSTSSAQRCFNCHTTGSQAQGKLDLTRLTPGVQCSRCHAGADRHALAIVKGKLDSVPPKLNQLTAEETSNLCGECHRTWEQVMRDRIRGEANVRFQPYRLANSKCYDGSDARISCTSCHDPHIEVARGPAAYDPNCLSCHKVTGRAARAGATQKACPVGKSECASCHMPQIELPGAHQKFTDHQIRIVRKGEPYPN